MSSIDVIRGEQYIREKYDEEVPWKRTQMLNVFDLCSEERSGSF